jgi:hypothetical protein
VARCLQPTPNARYASARELLRALEQMTTGAVPVGSALGWWVFHQVAVAVVYGAMTVAAWAARGVIGGGAGRTVFALTLTSAIVAAVVRLHLWFTSRHYPEELAEQRARVARWVQGADWLFAGTVTAAGLLIADTRPALAILLFSVGLGAAIAFLVIEPATARAAFRNAAPAPRRKG